MQPIDSRLGCRLTLRALRRYKPAWRRFGARSNPGASVS
jgi:hypothetical protein